jgi:hypothetical protein
MNIIIGFINTSAKCKCIIWDHPKNKIYTACTGQCGLPFLLVMVTGLFF